MNLADRERFGKVMLMLGATLGGEVNELQLEGYWVALGSLTIEQIEVASLMALKELRFMPRPAELLEIAERLKGPQPNWADAWSQLFNNHGETDDPIGQRALRALGGWYGDGGVGYRPHDDIPTVRAQFRDIYNSMSDSVQLAARPDLLPPAGADNRARLGGVIRGALKSS